MNNDTTSSVQLLLFDLQIDKQCCVCKQVFPRTNQHFHRNKAKKDGLCDMCKKCNSAKVRRWQKDNPEKTRAKQKQWVEKNPEKVTEYQRRFYRDNRERESIRKRKAREQDPEKFRKRAREYAQTNPETTQAKRLRHLALKRNANGNFTGSDIKRMTQEQNGCCYYCGKQTALTVDHKMPLSRGGSNSTDNLCMACRFCNSQKGARSEQEYREWLARN